MLTIVLPAAIINIRHQHKQNKISNKSHYKTKKASATYSKDVLSAVQQKQWMAAGSVRTKIWYGKGYALTCTTMTLYYYVSGMGSSANNYF